MNTRKKERIRKHKGKIQRQRRKTEGKNHENPQNLYKNKYIK